MKSTPVPLLATKLYVPPARADAVPRPRLAGKLLASVERPRSFTLLSGPAGSGKTTLLSEFVARLDRRVAWLSLDEGDNSPNRFWTYLIAACQPVLDDYHAIHNPSVHAGVHFLLDHLPDALHVIISTRVDPPWPLARYRVRNQLVQIRAGDLRFSLEETAEFLNRTMGLDLGAGDIAALEERTEGWIAGLQLAALSIQGRMGIWDEGDHRDWTAIRAWAEGLRPLLLR